jgi:predicted transglutaminase-like protease
MLFFQIHRKELGMIKVLILKKSNKAMVMVEWILMISSECSWGAECQVVWEECPVVAELEDSVSNSTSNEKIINCDDYHFNTVFIFYLNRYLL